MTTPEDQARETIDALLTQAGWVIQDANEVNLSAGRGVVIRNFPLEKGHGFADYLFYIDGKAAGLIKAKREGATLKHFSRESFISLPITIPAFAKQKHIEAEVEPGLSVIDELENTVEANLTRADRLSQSILCQAFTGQLST